MAYADYSYYKDTYKGRAVPLSLFDSVAERASEVLDALTFGRIETPTEAVKRACCAVCESVYRLESRGGADVQSEQVGSHRVTYQEAGAGRYGEEHRNAALPYLGSTGLLYRGFYDNEC